MSLKSAHMREKAREERGGVSGELPGVAHAPYPGRPVGPALFHLRYHDPITPNCACAFNLVKRLWFNALASPVQQTDTEEAAARQCPARGAIRAQLVPLGPASSIALFTLPLHALGHPGPPNPQALEEKSRPSFLKWATCIRQVNHSVRYDCSTPPWAVVGWGRPHKCAHATPAACWDKATPGADILRAMPTPRSARMAPVESL